LCVYTESRPIAKLHFGLQRPIDGRAGGVAEAILRTNDRARDSRETLERAATTLFRIYPDSPLFVNVTANVILLNSKDQTYSVYFGQRFSVDREILMGQTFDENGVRTLKATTYELSAPTDVSRLPLRFSAEYFAQLFVQNFGSSDVRIHSVLNVIYRFSVGLDNFGKDKQTAGQVWVKLF
jgi:hypothetical protein